VAGVAHTQQRLLRKLVGATYVMHFKVARRACVRKILCNDSLRKLLCKSKDTHEENFILFYYFINEIKVNNKIKL